MIIKRRNDEVSKVITIKRLYWDKEVRLNHVITRDHTTQRTLNSMRQRELKYLNSMNQTLTSVSQSYGYEFTHDVIFDIKRRAVRGVIESKNCFATYYNLPSHSKFSKPKNQFLFKVVSDCNYIHLVNLENLESPQVIELTHGNSFP